ncbi:MAG: T9SS type A sorting domain-containing protein, partial [Candidatus Kapaibacteriota bacterium]
KYILSGSRKNSPLNNRIFAYSNQQNVLIGRGITKQGKIVTAKLLPQIIISKADEMPSLKNLEGINDFPQNVKIFDIMGKEKFSTKVYSLYELQNSLENLENGLYFIQIKSDCKHILIKHINNN